MCLPEFGHQLIRGARHRETSTRRKHTKRAWVAAIPDNVVYKARTHFLGGVAVQIFADFFDPGLEVPEKTGGEGSEHCLGRTREGRKGEGACAFLHRATVATGELGGVCLGVEIK